MKKILMLVMAMIIVFSAIGCSKDTGSKSDKSSSKSSSSVAIEIADIDLNVEEVIENEQRTVMFDYTNNSDYTITYLKLRLRPKEEIKKEDFSKFKDFDVNYPEDWDVDYVFIDAEYGDDDNYSDGKNEEFVKSGETSPKEEVHRNNIMYVRDIEIYNMMEPDILTIQYIDDNGKEHKLNYDYKNEKYNEEKMNDWFEIQQRHVLQGGSDF